MTDRLFDWDAYGRGVMAGKIPVSRWTRLAVERHYRDLEKSPGSGYVFSEAHAQYALKSFLFVKHSKGEFAGRQFVPAPWQQFWVALAFGWRRADTGVRRFREVYQAVPRKNGKTTQLAAIGLYMLYADGEAGAEVYAAATKQDQARILYREVEQMVRGSPLLSKRIKVLRDGIELVGEPSRLVALGRDSRTMDGLNPHCAIIDEVHAHRTSEVYDVLKSGTGGRMQPLIWMITTAGFDLSSFGYERHRYAEAVLAGSIEDEALLAVIYTVDEPEAWTDPAEWAKANPNLGVSIYADALKIDCKQAVSSPSQQANFKTKRLNIWLASGTTWIPVEDWRKGADEGLSLHDFAGQECFIGLDLAEKSDVAAVALVFPAGGKFYAFFRFWLNRQEVDKPENEHFRRFEAQTELEVTAGSVTDFSAIAEALKGFCAQFDVREIAYDPYFSMFFATSLAEAGLPMVEFSQTARNMSPAITEVENLVLEGRLRHAGNRMMEWMMTNVVIRESKFNGLKHATKERREDKIDGPVALMMALSRAMHGGEERVDVDAALAAYRII